MIGDMTDAGTNRASIARTACSYCGVGCGIIVETRAGADGAPVIAKVRGDKLHPANAGRLCTKGATHLELMRAPGRMETAYRRPERGRLPPDPAALRLRGRARCGARRGRLAVRRLVRAGRLALLPADAPGDAAGVGGTGPHPARRGLSGGGASRQPRDWTADGCAGRRTQRAVPTKPAQRTSGNPGCRRGRPSSAPGPRPASPRTRH